MLEITTTSQYEINHIDSLVDKTKNGREAKYRKEKPILHTAQIEAMSKVGEYYCE